MVESVENGKKFTVAVEGNIGCGKSTFLQYFKISEPNLADIVPEPVELWKNVYGHNTLDLMYKDSTRWGLAFESYVQLTMMQCHQQPHKKPVKLLERSIYSSRFCFVENLYKNNLMPPVDSAVLNKWFGWINNNTDTAVDLIVYLRSDPEVCLDRIKKRKRSEESSVPIEYLQSLHDLHESWLNGHSEFPIPAPVLTIDVNMNYLDLIKVYDKNKSRILCGLK